MIEFQALMRAIHSSVKDAAKSVEGETVEFLSRFFDEEPSQDVKDVKDVKEPSRLRPKTCLMQFPSRTSDGFEMVNAEVPLLTLVPISSPRITEVKFTTELEINTSQEDTLMVSFPAPSKKGFFSGPSSSNSDSSTNAKIEITITGGEPPEGLKTLIEGYERALRAQIPG